MNRNLIFLVVFVLGLPLAGWTQYSSVQLQFNAVGVQEIHSEQVEFPLDKNHLYSWALRVDGMEEIGEFQPQFRYRYGEESWSEIQALTANYDLMDEAGKWMSLLHFLDEEKTDLYDKVSFEIVLPALTFAKAEIQFIKVDLRNRLNPKDVVRQRSDCEKPQMISRDQWCAGNCPPRQEAAPTHQQFMIVHHSASSNQSSNWAAVVESFYKHHVNGNGWDDIGYNWLVDPDGYVYEGRGDEKQGAHFCGQNPETAGICVIGTYIDVAPTNDAMQSLKELLSWKLDKEGLDPLEKAYHASSGKTIPRITGHRIACSTQCPGDVLFSMLQTFPQDVNSYMQDCGKVVPKILLKGELMQDASVFLYWESDMDAPESWEIYRKVDNENYKKLASVAGDRKHWTDKEVDYAARYTYYVMPWKSDFQSNEIAVITSLENIATGYTIYPNPVTDRLNVLIADDMRGEIQVEFYDIRGQKILPGGSEVKWVKDSPLLRRTIDLTSLQAGVYFMKIQGNNLKIQEKIVVQ